MTKYSLLCNLWQERLFFVSKIICVNDNFESYLEQSVLWIFIAQQQEG